MRHYRRVGIASTFSPTHRAVLAEAFGFLRAFDAQAFILHAAPRDEERASRFAESLAALDQSAKCLYLPGPDPVASLAAATLEHELDLLVAGALERLPQPDNHTFTGSVARRLLEEAPCDVLLLPRPEIDPPPITRAFFAAEPGQDIQPFIREVASLLRIKHAILAIAETPFTAALALSRGEEPVDTQQWAESVANELSGPDLDVETRVVDSNTGFGLCEAARSSDAHLMAVPTTQHAGRTRLPPHLDWMRQVIPTRLLVRKGSVNNS